MTRKPKQEIKRIERKMVLAIKKVQKEHAKRTGEKCSFPKASGLLCERYRKK